MYIYLCTLFSIVVERVTLCNCDNGIYIIDVFTWMDQSREWAIQVMQTIQLMGTLSVFKTAYQKYNSILQLGTQILLSL